MKSRRGVLIGVVVCLLAVPASLFAATTWTLCVGVGTYRDASIDAVPCTLRDARLMHALLTEPQRGGVPEAQAVLLVGDDGPEPTRAAILSALDRIEAAVGPEDSIIVFFSGHGADHRGMPMLMPSDTDPYRPRETTISVAQIAQVKQRTECQSMIVMLASCHSGIPWEWADEDDTDAEHDIFNEPGLLVLAGSSPDRSLLTDPNSGLSVFGRGVFEALVGAGDQGEMGNRDGWVTFNEAYRYLWSEMLRWSQQMGLLQAPHVYSNLDQDVTMVSAPLDGMPCTYEALSERAQTLYAENRGAELLTLTEAMIARLWLPQNRASWRARALTAGGDHDAAIAEHLALLAERPDSPEIINNLANAYARAGRYEEAITYYTRAIELRPDRALYYYNRGVTHHKFGHRNLARQDYLRALELKPDFESARTSLRILETGHE